MGVQRWARPLTLTVALVVFAVAAPRAFAAGYTITPITLGGVSTAAAINNAGVVTGWSTSPEISDQHAYRFADGRIVDLDESLRAIQHEGTGINNLGDIVGLRLDFDFFPFAFLLRGSTLVPELGGLDAHAWDVNDAGEVAGDGVHFADRHAFLWIDGVSHDLGTLGGHNSAAFATRRAGQAAGEAQLADGRTHAFLYAAGHMRDLGTLGGGASRAEDVNAANHVVGSAQISSGGRRAFLWTPADGMRNLGVLARRRTSVALAVNAFDQVVGRALVRPSTSHAFVWTQKAGMRDLNTLIPPGSGWVLNEATGINRRGQIVGNGVFDGRTTGFLLTPA